MRQVPYGIIGNGRVARHFCHYFDLLQLPYLAWSRQANSGVSLETLCNSCQHILLLINDDAIEAFITTHAHLLPNKTLIHFSGSLVTPLAYAAHPLSTFTTQLYDLNTYRSIPFFIEVRDLDFAELLPGLPNPHYKIAAQHKALYHSLCVLSGNFTVMLWQKFFAELENKFNIPKEAAFPYLKQIGLNLLENPATALTGPLVRGDQNAINANLAALQNDPFQKIYQAFLATHEVSNENS